MTIIKQQYKDAHRQDFSGITRTFTNFERAFNWAVKNEKKEIHWYILNDHDYMTVFGV